MLFSKVEFHFKLSCFFLFNYEKSKLCVIFSYLVHRFVFGVSFSSWTSKSLLLMVFFLIADVSAQLHIVLPSDFFPLHFLHVDPYAGHSPL